MDIIANTLFSSLFQTPSIEHNAELPNAFVSNGRLGNGTLHGGMSPINDIIYRDMGSYCGITLESLPPDITDQEPINASLETSSVPTQNETYASELDVLKAPLNGLQCVRPNMNNGNNNPRTPSLSSGDRPPINGSLNTISNESGTVVTEATGRGPSTSASSPSIDEYCQIDNIPAAMNVGSTTYTPVPMLPMMSPPPVDNNNTSGYSYGVSVDDPLNSGQGTNVAQRHDSGHYSSGDEPYSDSSFIPADQRRKRVNDVLLAPELLDSMSDVDHLLPQIQNSNGYVPRPAQC